MPFLIYVVDTVIVLLTLIELYITTYKLPLSLNDVYSIFPHSQEPIVSNSPRLFLFFHIILVLGLIVLTCTRLIIKYVNSQYDKELKKIHFALHAAFVWTIVFNIWNLGPLPWYWAVTVNAVGLVLTSFLLNRNWLRLYFLVLSTPALLEIYILYQGYNSCVVRQFNQNYYDGVWRTINCPFIPLP